MRSEQKRNEQIEKNWRKWEKSEVPHTPNTQWNASDQNLNERINAQTHDAMNAELTSMRAFEIATTRMRQHKSWVCFIKHSQSILEFQFSKWHRHHLHIGRHSINFHDDGELASFNRTTIYIYLAYLPLDLYAWVRRLELSTEIASNVIQEARISIHSLLSCVHSCCSSPLSILRIINPLRCRCYYFIVISQRRRGPSYLSWFPSHSSLVDAAPNANPCTSNAIEHVRAFFSVFFFLCFVCSAKSQWLVFALVSAVAHIVCVTQ